MSVGTRLQRMWCEMRAREKMVNNERYVVIAVGYTWWVEWAWAECVRCLRTISCNLEGWLDDSQGRGVSLSWTSLLPLECRFSHSACHSWRMDLLMLERKSEYDARSEEWRERWEVDSLQLCSPFRYPGCLHDLAPRQRRWIRTLSQTYWDECGYARWGVWGWQAGDCVERREGCRVK